MTKTNEEIGCSVEDAFELNDRPSNVKLEDKENFKKNLSPKRELYKKLSDQLESKLKNIQSNLYSEFIDQLINYVEEYKRMLESNEERLNQIKTGIISIKSSTTEYEFIFNQIIEKLNKNNLDKVIYLKSTSKLTLEKITGLFYEKIFDKDLFNKLGIIKNETKYLRDLKFSQFATIYKREMGNKPIILIIDDLASMNCELINLLFQFLHIYIAKLPVLVFCGLSQACVSLQSLIKPMVLSQLSIKSFTSKNTLDIVEQVFVSAFINSDLDLQFGHNVLTHFKDTFNTYDFSVQKIEHLAKLAIWFFCYENEFSYLNGSVEEFKNKLKKLKSNKFQELKKLPSLTELSSKDEEFKKQLVQAFENMNQVKLEFLNEIRAFYSLTSETRDGNSFCNLFIKMLTDHKQEFNTELNDLSEFLNKLSSDGWRERIEKINNDDLVNQTKLADILRKQLEKLDDALKEKSFTENDEKNDPKKKIKSRYDLAKRNLSNIQKQNRTPFNDWKKKTIELIKHHLICLDNPSIYYLNEIFYYDDLKRIKELNLVSFRETLIRRLEKPNEFAKLVQQAYPNELKSFKPDMCTAFKLYRESQVKINLADFLGSGVACLESNQPENTASAKKKRKITDNNEVTARFLTSIYDLGYLGLFERQGRSNDYIVKIVH